MSNPPPNPPQDPNGQPPQDPFGQQPPPQQYGVPPEGYGVPPEGYPPQQPYYPYPPQQGQYPPPAQAYPPYSEQPYQQQQYPPYTPATQPYPQQQPAYAPYSQSQPSMNPQSACGKFSIGLGLLGFGISLVAFVTLGMMGEDTDPESVMAQAAIFVMMGGLVLNFIGLILAMIGFMERNRRRATAWIGLIINGLPCLCGGGGIIVAIVLGMMALTAGGAS